MFSNLKNIFSFTFIGLASNALIMLTTFLFIKATQIDISSSFFYYVTIFGMIANISLFGYATYFNKISVDISKNNHSEKIGNISYYLLFSIIIGTVIFISSIIEGHDKLLVFYIFTDILIFKVLRERFFCSLCRAKNKILLYFKIQIIYSILKLTITYIYYLKIININMLFISYTTLMVLTSVYMFTFVKHIFYNKKDSIKKYFSFGSPFFIATIFTMGYDYAPVLILRLKSGSLDEIGYFSANYKIISIFILSLGIFTQTILPVQRKYFLKSKLQSTLNLSIYIALILSLLYVPVFLIFKHYSSFIISLFLGDAFLTTQDTFIVLLVGIWGSIFNFILFSGLQASDKEKIIPFIIAPCALLNIILLINLSYLGSYGAALSLTISLLFCAGLTFSVYIYLKIKNNDKI